MRDESPRAVSCVPLYGRVGLLPGHSFRNVVNVADVLPPTSVGTAYIVEMMRAEDVAAPLAPDSPPATHEIFGKY